MKSNRAIGYAALGLLGVILIRHAIKEDWDGFAMTALGGAMGWSIAILFS